MLMHDRFLNTLDNPVKTLEPTHESGAASKDDLSAAAGKESHIAMKAAAAGPELQEPTKQDTGSAGNHGQQHAPQGTGRPAQASVDAPRAEQGTCAGTSEPDFAARGASGAARLTAGP